MRIISGTSKGKKIFEPKDINTRPLKDLTKESIFNILNHSNKFDIQLQNSNVSSQYFYHQQFDLIPMVVVLQVL